MPLASLLFLGSMSLALLQQASSPLPPIYAGQPLGIAVGGRIESVDLDVDGDLDLIDWSEASSPVRFFLGTGTGTFASNAWPDLDVPSPEYLTSLAAGDFDGDGMPDLALLTRTGQAGRLHAFRGDAAGTYTAYTTMDFSKPGEQLLAIDMDGDGLDDLFALRDPWPKVSMMRSLGPAGFAPEAQLNPPPGYFGARDFAVGDITGDGRPDVLALLGGTPMAAILFENDGLGGFHAPVKAFDLPKTAKRLLLADLRGDGVLHAGSDAGSVLDGYSFYWLENDGAGNFAFRERFEGMRFPPSGHPLLPVRDLDGDGRQEWVVERAAGEYAPIFARGAGVVVGGLLTPPGHEWAAAGDYDSDGYEDLITEALAPGEFLLSLGAGTNGLRGIVASESVSGYSTARLIHLDGDGRLDVISTDWQGDAVHLYLGSGDGRFEWFQSVHLEDSPSTVATDDFDGDGRMDLAVVVGQYHRVEFLLQTSNGLFASVGATPRDEDLFSWSGKLTIDSDGDGRDELALLDFVDGLVRFAGVDAVTGPALLGAHAVPGLSSLVSARSTSAGRAEVLTLVASGTSSALSLWALAQPLSSSSASLTEELPLPLVDPDGSGNEFGLGPLAIDDLDGDGLVDVWATVMSWSGPYDQTCATLWSGLPSGGWSATVSDRTPYVLIPLDADDFDGDGALDFAYLYYYWMPWGPSPVRLQVHRPGLGELLAEPAAYAWSPYELGDLNGDGFLDFVHTTATSIVSVLNLSGR